MISKKDFHRYVKEAAKQPGCRLASMGDYCCRIEFRVMDIPIGVEVGRSTGPKNEKNSIGVDIFSYPSLVLHNDLLRFTLGYKVEKIPRVIELVKDYLIENGGYHATKKRERESKTYYSFAEYCARHDQSVFTELGIRKYVKWRRGEHE